MSSMFCMLMHMLFGSSTVLHMICQLKLLKYVHKYILPTLTVSVQSIPTVVVRIALYTHLIFTEVSNSIGKFKCCCIYYSILAYRPLSGCVCLYEILGFRCMIHNSKMDQEFSISIIGGILYITYMYQVVSLSSH